MQKIVVPFGIVGILIVCWVVGVIRAISADYSEKIAEYEAGLYNEDITSDNIIITNGATEGLVLAMWTLLNENDTII